MSKSKSLVFATAFFCASGWVCNTSAIGAESTDGAGATINAVPDAEALNATPVDDAAVDVTHFDTVSLNVQETDLLQVLQMLSIQGKRNIVPSPKVGGTVTANLYDVTFYEALDAILQQNAAGFIERGNFIYIYTIDELQKIEESQQKVEYKTFRLQYITATDAQAFITPLMSGAPEASIAVTGEVGTGIPPSEADAGANSWAHFETILVRDYPANLEEIAKVIADLDTPPSQVLVEATVLQAKLTDDTAFGVDISILADFGLDDILSFGSPLGIVDNMISGGSSFTGQAADTASGAVSSTVGNTADGDAGIKVGVLTNNVQVFVRALDSITDTTILANPKIMTLNRQRAEVLVGKKIAYVSTTTSATATTQTVEFLDTGTKLIVRPFVSPDGNIRLELKPSISSAELRDAGGGIVLPDETTQELTTNVMVPDGKTVVLGGLFTEQTTISRNQVPGLGDVPIIGNAFKGRDDSVTRDEVIFLITPHIVQNHAIVAAGEAAQDGIDQMVVGTRDGLLPWSRSKLTASHMRDALRHLEADDTEMAMWEVDAALGLDPTLVEARRLKERLTGERMYMPSRSLLEESADLMIERLRGQRPATSAPVRPNPAPNNMEPLSFAVPGELEFEPIESPEATETAQAETDEAVTDESDADDLFAAPAVEEASADAEAPAEAAEATETAEAVAEEPAETAVEAQPVLDIEPADELEPAEATEIQPVSDVEPAESSASSEIPSAIDSYFRRLAEHESDDAESDAEQQ